MSSVNLAAVADVSHLWEMVGIEATFKQTPWWAWLVLAGMIFIGLAAGKILSFGFDRAADRFRGRGRVVREIFLRSFARPVGLAAFTVGLLGGLASLQLAPQVRGFTWSIGKLLWIAAGGWLLYNLVAVVEHVLKTITARTKSPLDDQLVPLVRKTLRIVLIIMLGLFVADNVFHADIKSFLAGLGIIGLAFSLASQDTVKNFFGSVTIFVDQPFNLGDRIVLIGFEGIVEEIGFRSTKLRTANGHVIQIPNSKIVDSPVENISRRKFLRRTLDLPLPAATPPEKIAQAASIVREVLADAEIASGFDLERHPPRVAMEDLTLGGKPTLKIHYWFHPADQWAFAEHAQKLNLLLMNRLAQAGLA